MFVCSCSGRLSITATVPPVVTYRCTVLLKRGVCALLVDVKLSFYPIWIKIPRIFSLYSYACVCILVSCYISWERFDLGDVNGRCVCMV